jgi:hypothetical protein
VEKAVIVKPPESERRIKGKALQPELDELHPDAWERFERNVDAAIKGGPQHRQRPPDERQKRPAS